MTIIILGSLLAIALIVLALMVIVYAVQLDAKDKLIERQAEQARIDEAARRESTATIHKLRTELDLARSTVRSLLDAQRAGYRYPMPQPLPMPPDLDQTITGEFTEILARHRWPECPEWPR